MPRKAKRKFVALKVAELSMVGDPANEEVFLIAKSKGTDMKRNARPASLKTTEQDVNKNEGSPENDDAIEDTDEVGVVKAKIDAEANDQVAKALQGISSKLDSLVEKGKQKKNEESEVDMKAKLKKAGLNDKAIDAALSAMSDEPVAKGDNEQSAIDEVLSALASSLNVAKAKSFTPARIEKLLNIVSQLNDYKDDIVGKEAFGNSSIPASGTAPTPKPSEPPNEGVGQPENSIVAKSVDGDTIVAAIKKALEPLSDKVGQLAEDVEKMKKTRMASNQEPESKVQKSNNRGSVWTGVL